MKKTVITLAAFCMLAGTPAWAAEQVKEKSTHSSQTKKEKPQVIENAELNPKAKQALETLETILPEMKDWSQRKVTLQKSSVRSDYHVDMTKSQGLTYPHARVIITENTGEIRAFSVLKDRPSFPEEVRNGGGSSSVKEPYMKAATAASDELMKKLLGEKAANYALEGVNFISYGNSSTIVAAISYKAKIQEENTSLDVITMNIDASGQPAMFMHFKQASAN
ncbi:hypothetical protein KDJ56_07380 [Brevibacillus composti]|uniref:PepSY domain-containing protein n=1 Tax=Brevibacillus composti TaxID=2796470 RepID=A0A7T5JQ40_9BACL|nr:hypothetical protein [Brevibacillus composti]QQE75750.1 hypothetical protein JD108_07700 [Brevibacillus composti]QUO42776.1 hypothetical protein KDJ56_07380 [Brevibacillus composti]